MTVTVTPGNTLPVVSRTTPVSCPAGCADADDSAERHQAYDSDDALQCLEQSSLAVRSARDSKLPALRPCVCLDDVVGLGQDERFVERTMRFLTRDGVRDWQRRVSAWMRNTEFAGAAGQAAATGFYSG